MSTLQTNRIQWNKYPMTLDNSQISINWDNYPNFSVEEFDSPDFPGSGNNMQKDFLDLLQKVRTEADVPFVINSGYRSQNHNKKVGGRFDSAHLRGYAADIACPNSTMRHKILKAAYKLGVPRIGIYDTFIHLDNDPQLIKNVTW